MGASALRDGSSAHGCPTAAQGTALLPEETSGRSAAPSQRCHHMLDREFTQEGTCRNGMKLGSNRSLYQLVTQFVSWLAHEGELFRPPLLHARLHTMRTRRIDDQGHQRHTSAWRTEPAQRVQKADACHVHPLELGRLQDDH